jgi:hypothetical protein
MSEGSTRSRGFVLAAVPRSPTARCSERCGLSVDWAGSVHRTQGLYLLCYPGPTGPPELCAQVESCREHSPRLPRHGHDRAVGPRAARHPGTGGPTPRKTPPRGNRNLRLRQSKRKPPVSATIGPPTRVRLGRGLSRVLRARTSLARGLAVPHPNRRLTPQPRAGSCAREAVRPRPWWPGAVRYYQ